jgi:hypothetical protein
MELSHQSCTKIFCIVFSTKALHLVEEEKGDLLAQWRRVDGDNRSSNHNTSDSEEHLRL